MDRIPPEILCKIFLAALPHPTHHREYLSSIREPLHILHVCRSWRTLSLSFGELWSYLCIEYGFSSQTPAVGMDLKALVSVFDTWIERTNGAPLNFRVECYCKAYYDKAAHRVAEHIITTMISQQHRWRDVTLISRGVKPSPEFPGLNLINIPILTSLELDVNQPLLPRINIAQSSRLRQLCIRAPDFNLMTGEKSLYSFTESAEISFSYGISQGSHKLRVWLNVLNAAPFLTELIADSHRYMGPPLPRAQNEPLIQRPNLRVLKLQYDPASFIIDYVTIPNLQVLVLACSRYDKDVKAEMLASFIRRSLPPLTTLVIDWDDVREELILPILRLLPTLKYLRLSGVSVTRRFFHELTIPRDTGAIGLLGDEHAAVCPVLEMLFLQWIRFEEDADWWVAFIAMLKSRPSGLGKSDVVYLRNGYTVELSDVDEDIGESRREARKHIREGGVVIGDYEAVESLLQ